jgi:tetratricopeptide (TPR) repeat protein
MASLKEQSEKLFNMGLQYSENEQLADAIECYTKVINLTIDNRPAYPFSGKDLKESLEKKRKVCEKELELNPNLIMAYFERGKCKQELKDYNSAKWDYSEVIKLADYSEEFELTPSFAMAYVARGKCEQELKKYDFALYDYESAIGLANNSSEIKSQLDFVDIYYNIGICCENDELFGLTESEYKEIVEGESVDPAHAIYERDEIRREKLEQAIDAYNKAIELNPSYADAYIHRGNCYKALNQVLSPCKHADINLNRELALADYNKAIELNPSYAEAYNNRGNYYRDLGEYNLALADYDKAIELNSNYIEAYLSRGVCYASIPDEEIKLYPKYWSSSKDSFISNYFRKIGYVLKSSSKQSFNVSIDNISPRFPRDYNSAKESIERSFKNLPPQELHHKAVYLKSLEDEKELDRKNKELEEKNKQLELEIQQKEAAHKALHEKEKEMLSFFTHTMRNALATAPESLRQAIRLLGSEDYEKNQKHYEAINEITSLFSTLSLTDCLIDTFKQSIYDTEEFKRAWQNDTTGEATPHWFIAAALRQSLNRIIFMSDTDDLRKLLNNQAELIKPTRKLFLEQVLPLDINQQDVELFYTWVNSLSAIDVFIEETAVQFGANQIKFSLLFSITSELILNALKHWSGTGKIQVRWVKEQDYYLFSVKNACQKNVSSNLAGTHKGLAFIKRLMELLNDKDTKIETPADFNCFPEEHSFTAELKLHKTLLENNP